MEIKERGGAGIYLIFTAEKTLENASATARVKLERLDQRLGCMSQIILTYKRMAPWLSFSRGGMTSSRLEQ